MTEEETLRAITVIEIKSLNDFQHKLNTINKYLEGNHLFHLILDNSLIFNFIKKSGNYQLILGEVEFNNFIRIIFQSDTRWHNNALTLTNLDIVEEICEIIKKYERYISLQVMI